MKLHTNKFINTLLLSLIGLFVTSLIAWATWQTTGQFVGESERKSQGRDIGRNTLALDGVKIEVKEFRREVDQKFDKMQERIDAKQDKMLDILIRMDRRGRENVPR